MAQGNQITGSCPNCGGKLEKKQNGTVICPFCDGEYSEAELRNESEAVQIERMRIAAAQDASNQRLRMEKEREAELKRQAKVTAFKKSKFSKILIIFAVISAFVAFLELSGGFSMAGLVAALQAVLYLCAWLTGRQIIKSKWEGLHILLFIVALLLNILFFAYFGKGGAEEIKAQEFSWSEIEMREHLPEPQKCYGEVSGNAKDYLSMQICDVNKSDYQAYIDACIRGGYTIDAVDTGISYSAYNQEGYYLNLSYLESEKEYWLYLDAPEEMKRIAWPDSGLAALLPVPRSELGAIITDNSEKYTVHIGKTTAEEYQEYVKACEALGFVEGYERKETSYSAQNQEGYAVALKYLGGNRMEIAITAPKQEAAETTPPDATEQQTTPEETEGPHETTESLVDGMRPEFKEAMDAYEAFYDEYCGFLEQYANDANNASLMMKYLEMLDKAADMDKKFEAWDEDEMNDAEQKYYAEVNARVAKKLIDAAS